MFAATTNMPLNRSPNNPESRWIIAENHILRCFSALQGKNDYVPRMGVFTGGANAVFYLEQLDRGIKRNEHI